jgi:hypothetical protein
VTIAYAGWTAASCLLASWLWPERVGQAGIVLGSTALAVAAWGLLQYRNAVRQDSLATNLEKDKE